MSGPFIRVAQVEGWEDVAQLRGLLSFSAVFRNSRKYELAFHLPHTSTLRNIIISQFH